MFWSARINLNSEVRCFYATLKRCKYSPKNWFSENKKTEKGEGKENICSFFELGYAIFLLQKKKTYVCSNEILYKRLKTSQ